MPKTLQQLFLVTVYHSPIGEFFLRIELRKHVNLRKYTQIVPGRE
jgi:hypothetical protein